MNLYDVYSLYEVTPVKGRGAYVYDEKGQEYLDFYGGHAVISIGHSHPHYVKTITDQIQQIGFYSNSVVNPLQQELADKLEKVSGISGYDLFLINSGAEANDNALKLASFHNGRKSLLGLTNSFHGRTSAAINITHTGRKHQAPINHGAEVTYCNHENLEEILNEVKTAKHACIIIEGIQGVGGLDMINPSFLGEIRKACDKTDTIMIMDEVQCGYGRSGHFFSFQAADVQPDIITIAKGMGNGFPVGGVLIDSEKMPAVKSRLGTTYGGNHLACAASIAVLDVIESENLVQNAQDLGGYIKSKLESLPHVKQIKGKGLMMGLELDFPVAALRKKLVFDHHLFTGSSTNSNLLRLLPPLNINKEDVHLFLERLTQGLQSI